MIVILDLGSHENTVVARAIRALGVYSEIYPHDITAEELKALPNVKGVIINGGKNNVIDGVDCVIAWHTHKGAITRPSKIVIDDVNSKVTIKDYVVLSCVSWQALGAYPLQQMMSPTTISRPQSIRLISRPKEIELVW